MSLDNNNKEVLYESECARQFAHALTAGCAL